MKQLAFIVAIDDLDANKMTFAGVSRVRTKFFYSIGIGARGIIPDHPRDRLGLGSYYIDIRNPQFQGSFRTTKFFRDEYGFEAFYNIAITPSTLLTPDIQVVRGAQKDKVSIGTDSVGSRHRHQQKEHRYGDNSRFAVAVGVLN